MLGIRIEKLKGRILNRERINKTIEGIYFICTKCMKVCHSLDEGLQEDPDKSEQPVRQMRQGASPPRPSALWTDPDGGVIGARQLVYPRSGRRGGE